MTSARSIVPRTRLADICEQISSGGTPSRKRPEYFATIGGHRWVKSQELVDCFIRDTGEHITDEGLARSSAKYYPPNTVLIAMYGATVGKLAILKVPATVNQAICALRVDPERADYRYIYYALLETRDALTAQAMGAAQQNLNQDLIRNFEVPLPSLRVQRAIASILSAHDYLIENNTRRIEILEEMAQAIYRKWFVEFRYPGHQLVPLVDSGLGAIPMGWAVHRLADLVSTQYGYTESASTRLIGPKFLRGMDINKTSFIDWDRVPYCSVDKDEYRKFRLAVGDVVIIRMADPGKIGIVEEEIEAVFASYLVRVRPIHDALLSPYFLFYFLNSDAYQGFVTGASTGTTRKSVSAKVMTSTDLVIPPPALQAAFAARVSDLRRLIGVLLHSTANLRKTRDLLLTRLISGELDVSELDVDVGDAAA